MEKKEFSMLDKIIYLLKTSVKEYVIGTSIYLNSLFVLNINNQTSLINALFWMILMFFIFERFILKGISKQYIFEMHTKFIDWIFRIVFIGVNLIAFGLTIFK